MYLLEIDEATQVLLSLVGKILNIIHIGVPILLILFVSIDLAKAVVSQDNEQITKSVHSIKNRVIAALLVFLAPTFIEMMFSRVFVTLNADQEEYNKILSTYRSVIYSDRIDVEDQTKNVEISALSKYSIVSEQNNISLKNEQEFIELSKVLTPILFSNKNSTILINSVVTDNFSITYNNSSYKIGDKLSITYKSMDASEVLDSGNYVVSTITLNEVSINKEKNYETIVVNFYYLKDVKSYKLDNVSIDLKEEIIDYNKQLIDNEKPKEIIANSKYISKNNSYDYSKLNALSDKTIKEIYSKNMNNVLMIKTMYKSSVSNRAVGFFISDGVIATSWSFLQFALMNNQSILISDIKTTNYNIDGVVAIDTANDIVVLKLDKEKKTKVAFGDYLRLSKNAPILTITSKTGVGLSTITGIVSSVSDNILNVIPISKTDAGSPLFDSSGNVVGINSPKLVESELSSASLIDNLKKLQLELNNTSFKNIKVTSLDEVKSSYFFKTKNKEQLENTISEKIWKKYKSFGNVEDLIALDLVKASYYEGVLSLRYLNPTPAYVDNLDYANEFIGVLKEKGYKLVSQSKEKIIYKKGSKKAIIMSEFDYLIVVLVK